jgi:hypothetical protein
LKRTERLKYKNISIIPLKNRYAINKTKVKMNYLKNIIMSEIQKIFQLFDLKIARQLMGQK